MRLKNIVPRFKKTLQSFGVMGDFMLSMDIECSTLEELAQARDLIARSRMSDDLKRRANEYLDKYSRAGRLQVLA